MVFMSDAIGDKRFCWHGGKFVKKKHLKKIYYLLFHFGIIDFKNLYIEITWWVRLKNNFQISYIHVLGSFYHLWNDVCEKCLEKFEGNFFTPIFVLILIFFHYILSEFGQIYNDETGQPLVNKD